MSAAENTLTNSAIEKPALLKVQGLGLNLNFRTTTKNILENVNFQLQRGQTLGIVGESGSGKSMTALSIMRLLPESAQVDGQIFLHEQDLTKLSEKQMQHLRGNRIAMVFQEPMTALNPLHTIGNQLIESLRLHTKLSKRKAKEQAIKLLERVGISHAEQRFSSYPYEFSGGQCQRIIIAMALACNPDLLIADEPTTALDVILQRQILDLLDELVAERQMGLLLISHDLAVISEYADDVIVMLGGKVVEEGKTEQIFANPQHAYTQKLLKAHQRLMGEYPLPLQNETPQNTAHSLLEG